jgi:hypothetical protein
VNQAGHGKATQKVEAPASQAPEFIYIHSLVDAEQLAHDFLARITAFDQLQLAEADRQALVHHGLPALMVF